MKTMNLEFNIDDAALFLSYMTERTSSFKLVGITTPFNEVLRIEFSMEHPNQLFHLGRDFNQYKKFRTKKP